jgi:hypothetical protein
MRTRGASRQSRWSIVLAALAALSICVGVSRADIAITSEVTVTGGPSQSQAEAPVSQGGTGAPYVASGGPQTKRVAPATVTTYYKGKMARTEVQGGQVPIYDGGESKVYILHPDQKTYSVLSVSQLLEQPSTPMRQNAPASARRRDLQFDTDVRLVKSDTTKAIAGKEARRYVITASMQPRQRARGPRGGLMRFPRAGFPGGRRRFPGSGFLRSGGLGDQGQAGQGGRSGPPSVEVQGEYWLADTAFLPGGDKSPLLPLLQQTLNAGPILKDLNDKLVKMKLVPLASKMTVTLTPPGAGSQEPMVTAMEVKAITDEPLADTLFKVPADYKEVKGIRDSAS